MINNDNNNSSSNNDELINSIRSLRVKQLKDELDSRGISTADVFEKEELVQRLYLARLSRDDNDDDDDDSVIISSSAGDDSSLKKKKKKKKRRIYDDDSNDITKNDLISEGSSKRDNKRDVITPHPATESSSSSTSSTSSSSASDKIIVPFQYFSLESSTSAVAAKNAEDIFIRPSEGKYAAIEVTLLRKKKASDSSSSSAAAAAVTMNLLVDTACSGLVISPTAITRMNNECPNIVQLQSSIGATMTSAGGSQGAGVAKWDDSTNMMIGSVVQPSSIGSMSNVAAVQDIGALPRGLDGIIGLSFLRNFATVDFDFANGQLCLFEKDVDPPLPIIVGNSNDQEKIAQGTLALTKLGIYTTQVNLDGRGPVNMLVDTGAASSFLNWNGVAQLNLDRNSPLINSIIGSIGAMGADNMALQLTHRFVLKRRWNLMITENAYSPAGIELGVENGINVDIGDLPVLETLKGDGVGGILGADLLMLCDVVRFGGLNGRSPTMTLYRSSANELIP